MSFRIFSTTDMVVLPSEEVGNTENMRLQVVTHRTLDAQVTTYKRATDQKDKTFSFASVKNRDYNKLITLILESAGKRILFEDSHGAIFRGVISPGSVTLTSNRESGGVIYRNFDLNIKGVTDA